MFQGADSTLKRLVRWAAYAPPAVRSIATPSSRCRVTVDQESIELDSRLILVANSARLIIPQFELYPGTSQRDGEFDVLAFTADAISEIFRTGYRFLMQSLDKSPYVVAMRGKRILIESDPPLPVEIDGDLSGDTPLSIEVDPLALEIICGDRTWM